MPKFLFHIILVSVLAFAAPSVDAYSLSQQRADVVAALDDVIADLEAEIAAKEAELAGPPTPTPAEQAQLEREILILEGRLRFVQVTQSQVPFYNGILLDRVIVRYDLPVSLSMPA
jgi:hypothetical protein